MSSGLPEADGSPGRIEEEAHLAAVHDLHRLHERRRTKLHGPGVDGVDVIDDDVARPRGRLPGVDLFGAERAHSCDELPIDREHDVRHRLPAAPGAGIPAEHRLVERLASRHVRNGDVAPSVDPVCQTHLGLLVPGRRVDPSRRRAARAESFHDDSSRAYR